MALACLANSSAESGVPPPPPPPQPAPSAMTANRGRAIRRITVLSWSGVTVAGDSRPTRRPADQEGRRSSISKRSEEHTSELQSPYDLVCRLLLEKKK